MIGEFDLLIKDADGKTVIIDWKTSASRWPTGKAETDLQATAYLLAYQQMFGETASFRYDVVTKTKKPAYYQHPANRQEFDFLRFVELVKLAEKKVDSQLYYPCDSWACSNCPFKAACRNSHLQHDQLMEGVA